MVGREALLGELREQSPAVQRDLERATLGLHQLELGPGMAGLELGDQTGRLGQVVSLDAVFDAEAHGGSGGRGTSRARIPLGNRARVQTCAHARSLSAAPRRDRPRAGAGDRARLGRYALVAPKPAILGQPVTPQARKRR